MNNAITGRQLVALISLAALGLNTQARAAENNTDQPDMIMEEVVTVGVRAPYRGNFDVMESPEAVTLLDEMMLDFSGAQDLVSALDLSASVSRQNNFGGLWNSFALRGFSGDHNLPSNYLVNGFNAGRGFAGSRDIAGIEAIEVLKGPKAALFGRGEPGGTVNLITKRPNFERQSSIRLSAGRYSFYRLDADINIPANDNFAFRLAGFAEDAESFRDTVKTSKYGYYPSLVARLGDSTIISYELEYTDQEIPFDRGVQAINGQLGQISRNAFMGEPGDGPIKTKVLGNQLELQHEFTSNLSLLLGINHRKTSLKGYAHEPELSGSRQWLTRDGMNLSRFRRYRHYDADFTVLRAELAAEFQTGSLQHRLLIGADYDEFENDQFFLRYRGPSIASNPTNEQLLVINVFNPVHGQYPLPTPGPNTDRLSTEEALGFYVQDQISFSDQWQMRLGFRYDDFSQEIDDRRSDSGDFKQDDSRISPQLGLVYQATDDLSAYLAYGEGFRLLPNTDVDGNSFKPNKTKSTEIGAKFSLNDGRLLLTAALFSIEQSNIAALDPVNGWPYYLPIGKAKSDGFELDLDGEIRDGLHLLMSLAHVDARTKNAFYEPDGFVIEVPAGARLINIPNITLATQLVQEWNNWTLGGGMLYVDDRLGRTGTDFTLPSYTIARGFVEYKPRPNLAIRAEVDNLFDEKYYTNSYHEVWVQPGTPRSWRLSVNLSL